MNQTAKDLLWSVWKDHKMVGAAVHPFPYIITYSFTYTFNCLDNFKTVEVGLKTEDTQRNVGWFSCFWVHCQKVLQREIRWFPLQWNSCNRFNRNHIDRRKNNTTRHKFNQVFKTCVHTVKTLLYGPWGRHEVQFQEAREEKTKEPDIRSSKMNSRAMIFPFGFKQALNLMRWMKWQTKWN